MALSDNRCDLAFDTAALRDCGKRYAEIGEELKEMADELDSCLLNLSQSGWTTPAGTAFHKLTQTNWKQNIEKYANLLDTLDKILQNAGKEYEDLVSNHIEKTKL